MRSNIRKTIIALLIFANFAFLFNIMFIDDSVKSVQKCYGLYLEGEVTEAAIARSAKLFGKPPCTILLFWQWGDHLSVYKKQLNAIVRSGAIPIVTIEPWVMPGKINVPLADIVSGREDAFLLYISKIFKDLNSPIFIRFAHEMNGDWYPWSGSENNKNTHLYINAWRKVHSVISNELDGFPLYWIWSINVENVPNERWNKPLRYYPGDKYVDAVGVDGYNWGVSKKDSRWLKFDDIFANTLLDIHEIIPNKPIFITEVSSSIKGGDRVKWINEFLNSFYRYYRFAPHFVWFNSNKEAQWNLENNKINIETFRNGVMQYEAPTSKRDIIKTLQLERKR